MFASLVLAIASTVVSDRPTEWAAPIPMSGVGNFHKVNDSLYRSQQPSKDGFRRLESLGIRTVINLRALHSDQSKIKGTKLDLIEVDINTWHIEDEDIVKVLRTIRWDGKGPYLVHCLHGADRTGTVNAMYRMVVQGWTREQALQELTEGGYGFHSIWRNILGYLENVDIEKIKTAVDEPPAR